MNTGKKIELDAGSAADLHTLAEAEGMNAEGYLKELLIDRAARHLTQLKIDPSLFLPQMVECHQCAAHHAHAHVESGTAEPKR